MTVEELVEAANEADARRMEYEQLAREAAHERAQHILAMRTQHGLDNAAIADWFGIRPQRVSQIIGGTE